MANEAAPIEGDESLDDLAQPAGEATDPTTPAPDPEATWKRRIAGKDQALTATKKEAESLKSQLADYQRKLAAYEDASLSEVERLQKQVAELTTEKETATAEAKRLRLQGKFPLSFTTLGDAMPLDEALLVEIESRLSALKGEDEPFVDPNNPRRPSPTAKSPKEKSADDLEGELARMGNPLAHLGFGG